LILSVRVPTSQPPERPGQILREEFIKTGRLTQAALAQRMNVPVRRCAAILSGEEGITAETALLLEAALGVEAEFWIRAQSSGIATGCGRSTAHAQSSSTK
jgi:addiction module HigA family antidote